MAWSIFQRAACLRWADMCAGPIWGCSSLPEVCGCWWAAFTAAGQGTLMPTLCTYVGVSQTNLIDIYLTIREYFAYRPMWLWPPPGASGEGRDPTTPDLQMQMLQMSYGDKSPRGGCHRMTNPDKRATSSCVLYGVSLTAFTGWFAFFLAARLR